MAEQICADTDVLVWADWRRLAEKIDALAVTLGTPGYSPLTTDQTMPFIEAILPTVTGIQHFDVTDNAGGCVTVADRMLKVAFGGADVEWPGTPMPGSGAYSFYDDYAKNNKLFFVHAEDTCWCKHIFQVTDFDSSGYTLHQMPLTPKYGCCDTLYVPETATLLDYDQHIIPAGYSCTYGGSNAWEPPFEPIMYCPRCAPPNSNSCSDVLANEVEYRFTQNIDDDWIMTSAARYITGYLTWPILKEHMDALFTKLEYILDCARNDGYKPKGAANPAAAAGGPDAANPTTWWDDDGNDNDGYEEHGGTVDNGWMLRGSGCGTQELRTWLASLRYEHLNQAEAELDENTNGTLVETTDNYAYISNCSVVTEFEKPWETLTGTNTPENCGATGKPKVYCDTLNQMSYLIEEIADRVWPEGTFDPDAGTWDDDCESCEDGSICYEVYDNSDIFLEVMEHTPDGPLATTISWSPTGSSFYAIGICWDGTGWLPNGWTILDVSNYFSTVRNDPSDGGNTSLTLFGETHVLTGNLGGSCDDGRLMVDFYERGTAPLTITETYELTPAVGTWLDAVSAKDDMDEPTGDHFLKWDDPSPGDMYMESTNGGTTYTSWDYAGEDLSLLHGGMGVPDLTFNEDPAGVPPGETGSKWVLYHESGFTENAITSWNWSSPAEDAHTPLVPRVDCEACTDNKCCLLHEVFLETDSGNGCLEYITEVATLMDRVFAGEIDHVYHPDGECDKIRCGPLCTNTLPVSVTECLDQAAMVWSIETYSAAELGAGYDEGACAAVYYIEISAPVPPP